MWPVLQSGKVLCIAAWALYRIRRFTGRDISKKCCLFLFCLSGSSWSGSVHGLHLNDEVHAWCPPVTGLCSRLQLESLSICVLNGSNWRDPAWRAAYSVHFNSLIFVLWLPHRSIEELSTTSPTFWLSFPILLVALLRHCTDENATQICFEQ